MPRKPSEIVLLHVEDEEVQARLFALLLRELGFQGRVLHVATLESAIGTLAGLERERKPLDLVLSDIWLPDGTGLDVVRAVKRSNLYRMTPVVMLSNEQSSEVINAAYSLGTSQYLPKSGVTSDGLAGVRAFFKGWLECTVWPEPSASNRLKNAIARAAQLRAATCELYLSCSQSCTVPGDEKFWLDRALVEGNISQVLTFTQLFIHEGEGPPLLIDRLIEMQDRVERVLRNAEQKARATSRPAIFDVSNVALELSSVLDEQVITETMCYLTNATRHGMEKLWKLIAHQLRAVAEYVLARTDSSEQRERAHELLSWAERWEKA